MSLFLDKAIEAARAAGQIQRENLGKVGFREKGWADLVTDVDTRSQKTIISILSEAFPDHVFLGEESGDGLLDEHACGSNAPPEAPYTWIIDPLDGTTNYVHQFPLFGPSIALAKGNEILCGVIYNPISGDLFTAELGAGAFLNGEPMRVSEASDLEHALSAVAFPTRTEGDSPDFHAFLVLLAESQAIRRIGSSALNLAYVAAGRFDLLSNQSAHVWDVAAGVLMVREAGGVVTAPDGGEYDLAAGGLLAAATETLLDEFFEALLDE